MYNDVHGQCTVHQGKLTCTLVYMDSVHQGTLTCTLMYMDSVHQGTLTCTLMYMDSAHQGTLTMYPDVHGQCISWFTDNVP